MRPVVQKGFTFPEILTVLMMVGLAVGLASSFAGMRIDAEKTRAWQTEGQYVASLVEHAYRQGLLADNASTAAHLQAALPHVAIPTRLGGEQTYGIAIDGADPRILINIETDLPDGNSVVRTEVVRAPFPASKLRIPFWRARRLREIQEESE